MRSVRLSIQATVDANRDQAILEENGIRAVVIPHYKAPSFVVGDNQLAELLVMENDLEKARQVLGLADPDES